jgi:hypothetical protein
MCTIYTDYYSCGYVVPKTRKDLSGCSNSSTCVPTYRDSKTFTYYYGAAAYDTLPFS